ncbi:MAG: hypothetical protein WD827_05460 [Solirubrobacterales bacterium]
MRRKELICLGLLLLLGLLFALPHAFSAVQWTPDGLFYEVQKRQVQGMSRDAAMESVFESDLAEPLKQEERDQPMRLRGVDNPRWVEYSSRFYERRWTVPVMAALIAPIAGTRSLELVSLFAFALLPALLYLLLRRRFAPEVAAASSAFCALLPPLFVLAPHPSTDSWGLALLIVGLIVALKARDGGLRWLPVWVLVVLMLSFTRDATLVLLTATALLAFRERSRRMAVLLGSGVLASLPAPLIFSVPVRDSLAYALNDFRVPPDTTWGAIIGEYPSGLLSVVRSDIAFPLHTGVPVLVFAMGAIAIAGLIALLVSGTRRQPLETLAIGSAIGAALTVALAVNYTALRLELVFVPSVAVGVALLAERLLAYRRERISLTAAG